jgi:caa(3)-type oxidase subunit IV
MNEHTEEHAEDDPHGHHIVPAKLYVFNAVALCILMILTVVAAKNSHFHLSDNPNGANLALALAIGLAKTTCIISIFMGLWWSSRLVKVFALGAVFWLIIFFAFTMGDYANVKWWHFETPNTTMTSFTDER